MEPELKDEHEFFATAELPWTDAAGAPGVSERVLSSARSSKPAA